jgi:hypothetical protein
MFVFASFALLMVLLLVNQKKRFIYYIPFLLQLADIVKILIDGGPSAPLSVILDYFIIISSIAVCLVIIMTNVTSIKNNSAGIFIFMIYLFIMIFFSTDVWWSFKRYLNVVLSFLVFPAAFIISKDINDIKRIIKPAIWLILIFLVNVVVSTYFELEVEQEGFGYGKSFVFLGAVNFYSLYGFVYALILIPLGYYLTKKTHIEYFLILLYFTGLFVLILVLKRAYVYLTLSGALLFILFLTKRKNIRFIGPFFIIGLVAYVLLSDYILASVAIRKDVLRRGYTEEGRGIELILYPKSVEASKEPINFALFGIELFNSQGKFTIVEKVLNDKDRLLHSDLATILYGSGIIGLVLFVRIYYLILRRYLQYRKKIRHIFTNEMIQKLFASFVSVYMCLIINTLSDGMVVALNRVLPYMVLGAILGIMNKTLNSPAYNYLNTNTKHVQQ